jgi:GcrA cell cycle regulator
MIGDFQWTEAAVTSLCALWAAGKSASECAVPIAKEFGAFPSRNAIIGKVHRLGLTGRKTTCWKSGSPIKAAMPKSLPADAIPLAQRKTLIELTNATCRWPYGAPGATDFFFCGAEDADLSAHRPYCAFHERRAHARTASPSIAPQEAA